MSAIADLLDVGGSPAENAAMALIMLASASKCPDPIAGIPEAMGHPFMQPILESAGAIVAGALAKAEATGFTSTEDFRALVATGQMSKELCFLALEVIHLGGGPDEFFDLAGLAVAPAGAGGAQ